MGITGLIPFLEKASSKIHLKELRGSCVAIDSYCWLHKGVFSCADKLVRGEETDQYIIYCLKYVQMLLSYDIKPILVFDGQHLPAKALTEKRRRESRRESKKRAAELLRLGKIEEARSHMRRCVDVTHEMALRLIIQCRQRNVDCIVAPYEADAQLAWLNKAGIAQFVITEDSDLTLFGAHKVIFKLDLSGAGLLVEADKLHLAMGCSMERYNFDKFRRMCILSGCDYLDSLPGIGLAKACKFMLKTEQDDMWIALKKLPQYLNMKQLQVDDDYIENFFKAEATFKHMYIYNAHKRVQCRLHELEEFNTDERYCSNAGTKLEDNEQALNLALGNLNPFTLKQLDNWHPDRDRDKAKLPPKNIKRAKHKSIWQGFTTANSPSKNGLTNSKQINCAMYFKKVDFISKTIQEDLNQSLKEENAKPIESEVFQIYKNEAEEPVLKRKRLDSEESEVSISSSTKPTHHNPFAKSSKNATETEISTSNVICANSSLLKVLSPQKFRVETQRINSFRRRILENEDTKVEVRSRFFASNVELANESKNETTVSTISSENICATDLGSEMDSIERLSQQNAENQALLYHSPSPDKSTCYKKYKPISLSHTDSGFESIKGTNDEPKLNIEIENRERDEDGDKHLQSIEISDEEEKDCNKKTAIQLFTSKKFASPSKLNAFKVQQPPRIGLSKTRAKQQKSKSISNTNSNNNSSQNQTRLSMFGFQKRPALK